MPARWVISATRSALVSLPLISDWAIENAFAIPQNIIQARWHDQPYMRHWCQPSAVYPLRLPFVPPAPPPADGLGRNLRFPHAAFGNMQFKCAVSIVIP